MRGKHKSEVDEPDLDEGVGPIDIPAKRATEDSLGSLHGIVAEFLTLKLASGKATAAEVGAAITFLKNNSITADANTNAGLAALSKTLEERKKNRGGRLTPAQMKEADQAFGNLMGGMGLPQ